MTYLGCVRELFQLHDSVDHLDDLSIPTYHNKSWDNITVSTYQTAVWIYDHSVSTRKECRLTYILCHLSVRCPLATYVIVNQIEQASAGCQSSTSVRMLTSRCLLPQMDTSLRIFELWQLHQS